MVIDNAIERNTEPSECRKTLLERTSGEQFKRSAARIVELDPVADADGVAATLASASKEFFDTALPMFR